MPNIRDIKKKIVGVKSTQQITRAMKMVSTAKLRKAMEQLSSTKFYLEKLEQLVADLQDVLGNTPVIRRYSPRPVKTAGVVLVCGDRGLCGSFNSDLIKATHRLLQRLPAPEKKLILFGKKGMEFFKRREHQVLNFYSAAEGTMDPDHIRQASRDAVKLFTGPVVDGRVVGLPVIDELWLVFSTFVSVLERKIITKRLLPLTTLEGDGPRRRGREIIFEPNPKTIFDALVPRYVEGLFTRAVLESSASEQAARMIAMGAATDKADEIIDELTLYFNRTRQSQITKELAEVVSGADALAG